MKRVVLLSLVSLALTFYSCRTRVEEYDSKKYGKVINGVTLRKDFDRNSERIRELTKGSIIILLGEVKKKTDTGEVVTWYKVESKSGSIGYAFGEYIKQISLDTGEKELIRKRNKFEQRLKQTIVDAAAERIRSSNQFPYDRLTDLRIVSSLEPTSASSYDVLVYSWLKGAIFGIDTTSVSANVNLYIEIDYDNLPNSVIQVNHVDIGTIEKTEGIDPGRAIDLLVKVL